MSIIRRLIFKEWLLAWWGSVFIFFLLVSVGNIISELLRAAAPFADIMKHYVLELPKWMGQILPVACLTAGLFSVQKLKNRNELIAIFASGFSRQSFVMAILQVAGMVALLQLLLAGWVGPMARSARSEWLKEQNRHFRSGKGNGIQNTKISSGKIWYRGEDYFASFAIYQKETQELHDLSLYYFDQNNKITQWITAARAQYDLHNKSWRGHHGHHYWNLAQEDFQQGEIFPQKILPLQELPQDFADFDSDITALDLLNLYRYVSNI